MDDIKKQLNRIEALLRQVLIAQAPVSPNYRRKLAEYKTFDWTRIGARVLANDSRGPTEVEWLEYRFVRRSGSGKFGPAIWFSRPIGQSDNGAQYARLITFKDYSPAEPIAAGVNGKESIR